MKQYRAWYTGDNPPLLFEMVYVPNDELYFRMASDHNCRYPFETPFVDTDWIVEEGIGISDKNDKDVFQGDKLKNEYYTFIVFWDKNNASFKLKDDYGHEYSCNSFIDTLEIIGTIHDKEIK